MEAPLPEITAAIEGVRRAHRALLAGLDGLTDAQVGQPSNLPGWTVGHVLTHLARNADATRGMIAAANRGEQAPMYPSAEHRRADIEEGAGRPAAVLVEDLAATCAALESAWASLTATGWAGAGVMGGSTRPVVDFPALRWREVEVHRADLGLGYAWTDWPDDYVRQDLRRMAMLWDSRKPMGMTGLPEAARRAGDHRCLAWLLGRTEIDGLAAAGVY